MPAHRGGMSLPGLVLVTALGGACLSACAGGSTPESAPTTARPSGSASTGTTPQSSGPLTAYRSMWADLVSAARTSDFQSNRLASTPPVRC